MSGQQQQGKKKTVQIQSKEEHHHSNQPQQEQQPQEKLIAVILLDTYGENFKPLSLKKAECLLPIFGEKTLLDTNMEFLIENKVEEVYLFCTSHHQQIKNYIEEKKWRQKVELHFLYNFKCRSFGDAMREIDAKGLVRSNFILITGSSVVSTIKLKDHLDKHRVVSKTDKNSIMTMLCKSRQNDLAYSMNEATSNEQPLFILNSSNKILYYNKLKTDSADKNGKAKKFLTIPTEFIENGYKVSKQAGAVSSMVESANAKSQANTRSVGYKNSTTGVQAESESNLDSIKHLKSIQHRNDLIDAQIYLCSPYVLHMFTDNFDYNTMDDFILGVLVDEEISGQTIYADCLKPGFNFHFSLITNLNSYYFECMRLLQRVDLVLDVYEKIKYRRLSDRINVYVRNNNSVKLGHNVNTQRNVMIESNTKIGANCSLVNCIIGPNCVIGANSKLSNCIIWANCKIGEGCVINAAWLGNNVKIGNRVSLCENVLLANDCNVKDGTVLLERGVFVKKEAVTGGAPRRVSESSDNEDLAFSVNEDNFAKFLLNSKSFDESDEEDNYDFEPMEGESEREEEEYDDASSIASHNQAANVENDTSKNNHFLVWKIKSAKAKSVNHLLRHAERESDNDMLTDVSEYSLTSSDDDNEDDLSDDEDLDEEDEEKRHGKQGITGQATHLQEEEDTDIFYNETLEILIRGFRSNLEPSDMILEINSCKHANNIQIDDLCYYLTKALFRLPIVLGIKSNTAEPPAQFNFLAQFRSQTNKTSTLFENYFKNTEKAQRIFLDSMIDFFIGAAPVKLASSVVNLLDTSLVPVLHYLYNDFDFISEEAILGWYAAKEKKSLQAKVDADAEDESEGEEDIEKLKIAIKKLKPLIEWLQEDDNESEDE